VTAGILGRFERNNRVLFDLQGWQKFLAFTGGVLVLLFCIAFNVFGWIISAS
jgi:hypothetical protein